MGKIIDVIKFQHEKRMMNHWYESYWMVDMHGVISIPNYELKEVKIDFPPYAKEVLQILTKRPDIRLILFTSSYPDQVTRYLTILKEHGIEFTYINENPEIRSYEDWGYYETKPYFDVYLDDKAGFTYDEWKDIYEFLQTAEAPSEEWINPKRRRLNPSELVDQTQRVTSNTEEQPEGFDKIT